MLNTTHMKLKEAWWESEMTQQKDKWHQEVSKVNKQSKLPRWCRTSGFSMKDPLFDFFSCDQQLYRSLCQSAGWSVSPQNSPLFGDHSFRPGKLKFGMEVKCVWVEVCVCADVNRLKGDVVIGVAYRKKVHNFQTDSQTCTRFNGKVGHVGQLINCSGKRAKMGVWRCEWHTNRIM